MNELFYRPDGTGPISIGQFISEGLPVMGDIASRVDLWAEEVRGEQVNVSTVFLGIDHGWGRTERPLIYETMVFGGWYDGHQRRYASREEAQAGHDEMIKVIQLEAAYDGTEARP